VCPAHITADAISARGDPNARDQPGLARDAGFSAACAVAQTLTNFCCIGVANSSKYVRR